MQGSLQPWRGNRFPRNDATIIAATIAHLIVRRIVVVVTCHPCVGIGDVLHEILIWKLEQLPNIVLAPWIRTCAICTRSQLSRSPG